MHGVGSILPRAKRSTYLKLIHAQPGIHLPGHRGKRTEARTSGLCPSTSTFLKLRLQSKAKDQEHCWASLMLVSPALLSGGVF